jgi:hypothetical protein
VACRDYSEEKARVQEQIVHLEREIIKLRMRREDFSALQSQKDAADAQMDRLIGLEPEPAHIEYCPTLVAGRVVKRAASGARGPSGRTRRSAWS